MKTLATLTIGTVIAYNDMANVNEEFIVLNTITNDFGTYVNVMRVETQSIELKSSNTEIDNNRWTIKTEA